MPTKYERERDYLYTYSVLLTSVALLFFAAISYFRLSIQECYIGNRPALECVGPFDWAALIICVGVFCFFIFKTWWKLLKLTKTKSRIMEILSVLAGTEAIV